ncbi:hypothetical protein BH10ACT3_BH10ACT3_15540 [soil metagenome]
MSPPQPTATPRRGRPRLDSRPVIGDPQEAILNAAARLVNEHGVSDTSISRIAKEVGLTQSSVYYYFANKTEILVALMNRGMEKASGNLQQVIAAGGSPAVQLFEFIRSDVRTLCDLELDMGDINRVAARDRASFATYWDHVAQMEHQLADLLRRGVAEQELRTIDPALAATTILANNEGALTRFQWGTAWTSEQFGEHLADMVLRGLLIDPGRIDEIRRRADELNAA